MSKHKRVCYQENGNVEDGKTEHNDTEDLYDASEDRDHEYRINQDRHNEEEVLVGNEAFHEAEQENGMIEDERNGSDEDVGHNVNDQRHQYLAISVRHCIH